MISWFIQFFCNFLFRANSYLFFIEFNSAHGLQIGTPIRMRGVYIGSIQHIRLKLSCVLVTAKIESSEILIPRRSVIEITQAGLLSDPVLEIIPCNHLLTQNSSLLDNPLSASCNASSIICSNMYVFGSRGLNYDDLIRSATRISQRFDDPRFFNLFYVFLCNSLEATDAFITIVKSSIFLQSDNFVNKIF